jgi:lysozyme
MARTPEQARAWALAQVDHPDEDYTRECLRFVRKAFDVDYVGAWPDDDRNAGTAWDRARFKHPASDPDSIPGNVAAFFETSGEADHVVFALGGGWCLTNDFKRTGRIDRVRIADIVREWNAPLKGWTEDLVGNRVIPSVAAPTPAPAASSGALRVDGVDISHHNPQPVDFAAAKRAGVKWIYHKATEGSTVTDANLTRRGQEAMLAGIPFGTYHFARPDGGDAAAEARHYLSVAKPGEGDLRPMLDLEDDGGLSRSALTRWVGEWVAIVEKATGGKPIIYTPFDLDDTFGCLLWVARYHPDNAAPRVPAPWKAWDIRQFSNGVVGRPSSVAGFGHVDLNTMRKGLTVDDLTIKPKRRKLRRWRGRIVKVWTNLGNGTDDQVKRDLSKYAAGGAHVILMAEAGDRQHVLAEWAEENAWTYSPGDGSPGAASTPALIRDDVFPCVVKRRTSEAVPATQVGAPGAGPAGMKRKTVNELTVRRAGRLGLPRRSARFLWGHWPPSVDQDNLANTELRRRLHRRMSTAFLHVAAGGRWILKPLTTIDGDFNTEWDSPLMDPYRDAGFVAIPTGPTHVRRVIDLCLVRGRRMAKKIRRAFTVAGSSDHNAVATEID